MIDMIHILRS
uniref:Uncharacterized protein n=1 Tax=Arundo donax TaxID=35708 RepID=A0A0A8YUT5_ARUDO